MSGKPGEEIADKDLAEAFERLDVALTGLRGADASSVLLDEAADVLAGLKADVAALEERAITAEAACEEAEWGGAISVLASAEAVSDYLRQEPPRQVKRVLAAIEAGSASDLSLYLGRV